MPVIWSPGALQQVARIFEYLRAVNPQAAAAVSQGLIAAGDSLANFPHRGRPVPKTGMRELVTSYPYILRYRIVRDGVRILRGPPHVAAAHEAVSAIGMARVTRPAPCSPAPRCAR